MSLILLAAALDIHPFDLVRVDDPDYPGADARSATGVVLLEPPPPGVPWRTESVPETDGWVAEEALAALNAEEWHARGITGQGVKVAIFDLGWFGAEGDPDELGDFSTQDCYAHPSCEPPMDTYRPRFTYEEGSHGYACAEVVHDIAPDARIYLVRVNGETTLENAVDWAIREDVDVVSMSMSFFNASFYDGSGPVSNQAERLHAADIVFVTSAGNYADSTWRGPWRDGNLDGRLDFHGDDGLLVYLDASKSRGLYVNWNQHRSCGTTDLDAVLTDLDGFIVGRAASEQDPDADRCEPVERMRAYVAADGWYRLEVALRRGAVGGLIVNVLGTKGDFDRPTREGSIADPGSSPFAFAVGAVRADENYLFNDVESFSSWGPNAAGQAKPDIAGPDGLSTAVYGARGFYGTSAAAPSVAGAIALALSEDPSLTPLQAARRLQGWAAGDDVAFGAPDPRFGAGRARLPGIVDENPGCGRRPLWMPLFLLPIGWFRRKVRSG